MDCEGAGTFWLSTALRRRLAWCMKACVKESPEWWGSDEGEAAALRGDAPGVSISAATERRRGTASSMSSGGCLRNTPTLHARQAVIAGPRALKRCPYAVKPEHAIDKPYVFRWGYCACCNVAAMLLQVRSERCRVFRVSSSMGGQIGDSPQFPFDCCLDVFGDALEPPLTWRPSRRGVSFLLRGGTGRWRLPGWSLQWWCGWLQAAVAACLHLRLLLLSTSWARRWCCG